MGYSALNQQFHAAIYDVCPNRTAADLLIRLKKQMRKYNAKTILVPGRDDSSFAEHRAILDAIRQKDAAAAESCMCAHVGNMRKTFEEYYSLLF